MSILNQWVFKIKLLFMSYFIKYRRLYYKRLNEFRNRILAYI